MHFCNNCGNMYYVMLGKKDTNSLIYHCRKCGDENEIMSYHGALSNSIED